MSRPHYTPGSTDMAEKLRIYSARHPYGTWSWAYEIYDPALRPNGQVAVTSAGFATWRQAMLRGSAEMERRASIRAESDVEVIKMTAAEWNAALQTSLDDLGLTWEQLAEQAATSDFTSLRARKLWLMAGPQGFCETAEEGRQ